MRERKNYVIMIRCTKATQEKWRRLLLEANLKMGMTAEELLNELIKHYLDYRVVARPL